MAQTIDPRTTRRRVPYARYNHNSALYATYRVIGYEGKGVNPDCPEYVVLEKKPEFIAPPRHARNPERSERT